MVRPSPLDCRAVFSTSTPRGPHTVPLATRPRPTPPAIPPSKRHSAPPDLARTHLRRGPPSHLDVPSRARSQDPTLEAIKQKRLAELGGMEGMPQSAEEQQARQAEAEARAEQRAAALASLMDPKARERLSRIALVKPDKAQALENMLLQAAQRGQLGGKVTEDALIKMLEQINGGGGGGGDGGRGGPKITMTRRRDIMDDDDW